MLYCPNSTLMYSIKTYIRKIALLAQRTTRFTVKGTLIAAGIVSSWASAATFELPPKESRIVGRIQQHEVAAGETLAIIAKQYDIGFLSLMAANKGVDPFLPPEGYALSIPSRLILPIPQEKG